MDKTEKLQIILSDMSVPVKRRFPLNIGWLNRNLAIRNKEHPRLDEALSLLKDITKDAMKYKCKACGSTNVQIGMWVNPNTMKVMSEEPLFDINQAPDNVGVQWCENCEEHTELEQNEL